MSDRDPAATAPASAPASGPATACPSCRSAMKTEAMARHTQGSVNVELCFACAGIWFDPMVSVELAPAAVISLFKEIHTHRQVAQQPLASRMSCPRCGDALVQNFDVAKSGRFSYYRCARGDGRFTPFFQFLIEKQFVRNLTPAEVQQLRSKVQQINCSHCGAPIDLATSSVCKFCRAPVSFLDPDAVEKAVGKWSAAQQLQDRAPATGAVAEALMRMQHISTQSARTGGSLDIADGIDLVGTGIRLLGHLLAGS